MRIGVGAALIDGTVVAGDVAVDEGRVTAVGLSPPGRSGIAVPGFVDLQVNGFAGVDFAATDADGYAVAGDALVATGVTSYQPTLISLREPQYEGALATADRAMRSDRAGPRIMGVHLEGPFLSPRHPGAHDPSHLVPVEAGLLCRLLEAAPIAQVTLAPELPGAIDLVSRLVEGGVVVACGHTDADTATAHAAFDAGATAATHLFNAQRAFHHRDPGIVGVALTRDDVVVTIVLDGHHLAAETVALALRAKPGRIALVTDATAATQSTVTGLTLGPGRVSAGVEGVRREDGTLAGGAATMDQAIRSMVGAGAAVADAVAAATSIPARLAGRPELGTIEPGTTADVVTLDDRLEVIRTLVAGRELFAR